jgi:hypothetical protein
LRDPKIQISKPFFSVTSNFREISGVNTESVYFGIIGGPTLGFSEPRIVMKKIFGAKYRDPKRFRCWEIYFSSIFKNIYFIFTPKKTPFLPGILKKSLISQLFLGILHQKFLDQIISTS